MEDIPEGFTLREPGKKTPRPGGAGGLAGNAEGTAGELGKMLGNPPANPQANLPGRRTPTPRLEIPEVMPEDFFLRLELSLRASTRRPLPAPQSPPYPGRGGYQPTSTIRRRSPRGPDTASLELKAELAEARNQYGVLTEYLDTLNQRLDKEDEDRAEEKRQRENKEAQDKHDKELAELKTSQKEAIEKLEARVTALSNPGHSTEISELKLKAAPKGA